MKLGMLSMLLMAIEPYQHFLYTALNPWFWVGNVTATIFVAVPSYLYGKHSVIPRLKQYHRETLEAYLSDHEEKVKQHFRDEFKKHLYEKGG